MAWDIFSILLLIGDCTFLHIISQAALLSTGLFLRKETEKEVSANNGSKILNAN